MKSSSLLTAEEFWGEFNLVWQIHILEDINSVFQEERTYPLHFEACYLKISTLFYIKEKYWVEENNRMHGAATLREILYATKLQCVPSFWN